MKKLVFLLLGIVLGALGTYFYCSVCKCEAPIEIGKPQGLITPQEAINLDREFDSRHRLISDSIVKRPDNRSSWYSLGNLRNYLNYAEYQARDLGYTMDGVRIYLGAHQGTTSEGGYTTMFLIPTGTKGVSESNSMPVDSVAVGNGDIPEASGLNNGEDGQPPAANYPQ